MRIVFAHGLEGSPQGRKVTAMKDAGLPVEAPDYQGKPLAQRIEQTLSVIGGDRVILGGSSYGGLVAAWIAQHHPERVGALLLVAPALLRSESPSDRPTELAAPAGIPVVIIHGLGDESCPIDGSRSYRDRSGDNVDLREVRGKHMLGRRLPEIVSAMKELFHSPDTSV